MRSANSSESTCSDYIFHRCFYFPSWLYVGVLIKCKFPCPDPCGAARLVRSFRLVFSVDVGQISSPSQTAQSLRPSTQTIRTLLHELINMVMLLEIIHREEHFPPGKLQADVNVAENHPLHYHFPVFPFFPYSKPVSRSPNYMALL